MHVCLIITISDCSILQFQSAGSRIKDERYPVVSLIYDGESPFGVWLGIVFCCSYLFNSSYYNRVFSSYVMSLLRVRGEVAVQAPCFYIRIKIRLVLRWRQQEKPSTA